MTSSCEITSSPPMTHPAQKPLNFSIARIMQPDPISKDKYKNNFPKLVEQQDDQEKIDVVQTESTDEVLQRIDSAFKKYVPLQHHHRSLLAQHASSILAHYYNPIPSLMCAIQQYTTNTNTQQFSNQQPPNDRYFMLNNNKSTAIQQQDGAFGHKNLLQNNFQAQHKQMLNNKLVQDGMGLNLDANKLPVTNKNFSPRKHDVNNYGSNPVLESPRRNNLDKKNPNQNHKGQTGATGKVCFCLLLHYFDSILD